MTVAALSTHKCTITRIGEPIIRDVGDPIQSTTTIGANIPCRFDRVSGRRTVSVITQLRITGRLFIDGSYNLDIHENDVIDIAAETGKYAIERLDKVFAANTFHHWEIDLVDHTPE